MNGYTPGPWDFACDSYGKVRHSRKACVYSRDLQDRGEESKIASQIANWDDARVIAASPRMLASLRAILLTPAATDFVIREASAAIAAAEGRE